MSHRANAIAAVAVGTVLICGCSTRTQVRNAAVEAGVVNSYRTPFAQVQKAALGALSEAAFAVSEERWLDRGRWSVLAVPKAGALSPVARIVVEDHPTDCRVWVLVQNKPDVLEDSVAEALQGRIAKSLGQETPPERPLSSGAGEKEERYRSPLPRCSELMSKTCRDRGYQILRQDLTDAALRTITAEKKPSQRLFAALYRQSAEVTRVVVEVRGGTPGENKDEASAIHQELLKELPSER